MCMSQLRVKGLLISSGMQYNSFNIIKDKYKFVQRENMLNFEHFELSEKINSM